MVQNERGTSNVFSEYEALLVGDVATGINDKYVNFKDHTKVTEKCVLKLRSGTPVTQFVFGHVDEDEDLEDEITANLASKTTIRHHERPNELLPPLASSGMPTQTQTK